MKTIPISATPLFVHLRRSACLDSVLTVCNGCAYTYPNATGAKHIVGLVKVTIKPGDSQEELAGDAVRITGIGVSRYATPLQKGIVLGYHQEDLTALHQNVALFIKNPV